MALSLEQAQQIIGCRTGCLHHNINHSPCDVVQEVDIIEGVEEMLTHSDDAIISCTSRSKTREVTVKAAKNIIGTNG